MESRAKEMEKGQLTKSIAGSTQAQSGQRAAPNAVLAETLAKKNQLYIDLLAPEPEHRSQARTSHFEKARPRASKIMQPKQKIERETERVLRERERERQTEIE